MFVVYMCPVTLGANHSEQMHLAGPIFIHLEKRYLHEQCQSPPPSITSHVHLDAQGFKQPSLLVLKHAALHIYFWLRLQARADTFPLASQDYQNVMLLRRSQPYQFARARNGSPQNPARISLAELIAQEEEDSPEKAAK